MGKSKEKPYIMTTRMDTGLYLSLQKMAVRERTDLSKLVRRILIESLASYKAEKKVKKAS